MRQPYAMAIHITGASLRSYRILRVHLFVQRCWNRDAMQLIEFFTHFPNQIIYRTRLYVPISPSYPEDLKGLDKLYVVGDSHVVPLAWNILSVGGQPRILRPLLSTGIKHYHLRSEGDFYPKAQFVNNLKSIPNGSDILFVCGEIDCREGLLVAVEKDIYPNIQAGMRSTLKHFSAALPPLLKQRKMKNLFVHPVLPMLDETRPIVIEYNKFFKDIIDDLESKSKREKWGPGSLRWLNFFESLFVPGSGSESQQPQLLKGLRMDGTHISPAYLKLLEESLL